MQGKKRILIDECTLQIPDKTNFQSTKAQAGGEGESILKGTHIIELMPKKTK
jgi:hypothetical protein